VPQVEVIFYKEDEAVLIREWLKSVSNKAQRKCLLYIAQLEARGHELRRPIADYLRDGIYELRPSVQGVPYRMLYFFAGRQLAVLSHGITKEGAIPDVEIKRAIARKKRFEARPEAHAYRPGSKGVTS